MMKIRIIPRLDVKGPNVVKGIQFEGLRIVGKPSELAQKYYQDGADEIIYIDTVASLYGRDNLTHIIEETIEKNVFIPITVGGGIRSVEDIDILLRAGADKVAINTAAVKNPDLIWKAAEIFGSSTIILSIEAKKIGKEKWEVYVDNGREQTGLDVIEWVQKAVTLGVGEILVTSVDQEGMRSGYDLELLKAVTDVVSIPVIASGGAGSVEHIEECMQNKDVNGIAIASLFHYNEIDVLSLKDQLKAKYPDRIKEGADRQYLSENNYDIVVSIVDYSLGNIKSVTNALIQIGARWQLVDSPEAVLEAQYLILPGVGAYGEGMKHLQNKKLDQAIIKYASTGKPLLGICLGMQLLMSRSFEFGEHQGLDLIKGDVKALKDNFTDGSVKIPHVGWNKVLMNGDWNGTILNSIENEQDAYFIHSFYVQPEDKKSVIATTMYSGFEFCSAVKKDNIYGCQFHPEKSSHIGLSILKEFTSIEHKEGVVHVG